MASKRRTRSSLDPLSATDQSPKKAKNEAEETSTIIFTDDNSSQSVQELLDELPEKVPEKKKRGLYSRYDRDDLLAAVKMVKTKTFSAPQAARYYNVPKSTLLAHIAHNGKNPKPRGVEPTMKAEEEQEILSWLIDGSDIGDPRRRDDIFQVAMEVLKANDREHVFKNGIPTEHWVRHFIKRHKSCFKLRKRSDEIDEGRFFAKFYSFLEKNDYMDVLERPDAFYIMEDANFELDPEKITSERRKLLRRSLIRYCDEPSSIRLENSVTVTYCFCADGTALQQLLIFRETFTDMYKVALADKQLGAKFLFTKTVDGGNTNDTFRSYLERLDSQLKNVQRPIFIFCSETLPHIGVELGHWCNDKKIFIISFIPSKVSILNTIDDRVFGTKNPNGWKMEIINYQKEKNKTTFSEVDFVHVLKTMNDLIIRDDKVKEAFKDAGIFPFDMTKRTEGAESEEETEEEEPKTTKKPEILVKLEQMGELCKQLYEEVKVRKNEDMILNVKIIEQQLGFIKAGL